MEIKDRIRLTLESQRLTAAMFADRIGVQRSNVSHVLSGRNKPSFEFLEKLLIAFPKVSAHWLVTGKQVNASLDLFEKDSLIDSDSSEPQLFSTQEIELNDVSPKQAKSNNQQNVTIVNKRIVKTLVFYDDFSFDVYLPNEQ